MTKIKPLIIFIVISIVIVVFFAIILNDKEKNNDKVNTENLKNKEQEILINENGKKQLNVTILLDLSDRISKITYRNGNKVEKNFEPKERDLNIINNIITIFREHSIKEEDMKEKKESKGDKIKKEINKLKQLKSKIKITCSPYPEGKNIDFDKNLKVDFSKEDYNGTIKKLKVKQHLLFNFSKIFNDELDNIYKDALSKKNFPGSNIWWFFKEYVKSSCIDKNYRNILVIFTDGYIYHEDSIYKEKNRYSYITGSLLNEYKFRDKKLTFETIKQKIDKQDFGLITPSEAVGLQDLEVLVVEVLPNKQCKFDGDIIKEVLKKWFNEMGVIHSDILFSSEDKNLTASRIKEFFDYIPDNN